MRLTEQEKRVISSVFIRVFHTGCIYLFGSRGDDRKKGGDLDLYLVPEEPLSPLERQKKKRTFSLMLEDLLGEQKIDIIVAKNKGRRIEQEALRTGVLLWN